MCCRCCSVLQCELQDTVHAVHWHSSMFQIRFVRGFVLITFHCARFHHFNFFELCNDSAGDGDDFKSAVRKRHAGVREFLFLFLSFSLSLPSPLSLSHSVSLCFLPSLPRSVSCTTSSKKFDYHQHPQQRPRRPKLHVSVLVCVCV